MVAAVERWAAAGRDVRVHDPHITLDSIYGSNRNFLLAALPHVSRLLEPDLGAMLAWCDCVVTGQVPGGDAAQRIAASGKRVIDLAGARWRGEP